MCGRLTTRARNYKYSIYLKQLCSRIERKSGRNAAKLSKVGMSKLFTPPITRHMSGYVYMARNHCEKPIFPHTVVKKGRTEKKQQKCNAASMFVGENS